MRLPAKLALFVLAAASAGAATKAIRTYEYEVTQFHPARGPIAHPPASPELAALRDVSFTSADGTVIRGWYVPSKNRAAVVFIHGSPGNRSELLAEGRALARGGFGVLLFDMPGHGDSGGRVAWSGADRAALVAATDYVAAQPDVDPGRIGAYGFSMGSSITAQVAARDPRLRAVVLAGAFTTEEQQLRYEFRKWGPITQLPALWAARREGLAIDELRTATVIEQIAPRPLLLVAGDRDDAVPVAMTRELFDAARGPKELFVVHGATHGGYVGAMGDAYTDKIRGFFSQHLTARS
jgi:dipeptidyl aminopeptidase/acylaminoacyl peptidase